MLYFFRKPLIKSSGICLKSIIFEFNKYLSIAPSSSFNFFSNNSLFSKYLQAVLGPHFLNTPFILSLLSPVTIFTNKSFSAFLNDDFLSHKFLYFKS